MPEVELRTHTDADPAPEEAIRLVASGRGALSFFLGNESRRAQILRRHLRWDRLIVAYEHAQPIGFVAFQIKGIGRYAPRPADFAGVFGIAGGAWRYAAFWIIEYRGRFVPFYLYGLKVEAYARRRGVGSALMKAAEAVAVRHGAAAVELEVAADNPAAQAMYARLGYSEKKVVRLGWAARFFAFPSVHVLSRKVGCH